jgi:uncharacterized membrane protein (DUF2068 family)
MFLGIGQARMADTLSGSIFMPFFVHQVAKEVGLTLKEAALNQFSIELVFFLRY